MNLKVKEKNNIWKALLELNQFVRGLRQFKTIQITINPEINISINENDQNNKNALLISQKQNHLPNDFIAGFFVDNHYTIYSSVNNKLKTSEFNLLKHYLPYILNYFKALQNKKSYVVSHFAQTLDGKIATVSGHSKWIGNEENLIHAHRMRALCDGILIGANTYMKDKPRLTVRHVEGNNPVKIVLGNSYYNETDFKNEKKHTLCLTSLRGEIKKSVDENVICFSPYNGLIDPNEITEYLFKKGIYTVYLEGGAFTTSHFLKKKALNEIQLFLSPAIFGSGISNFSLNQIDYIKEAVTFRNSKFLFMGKEGIMFCGEVNYSENGD